MSNIDIKVTDEQIKEVKQNYVFPSFHSIANPKYNWMDIDVEGIIRGQDIYPKDEELIMAAFKADPLIHYTTREPDNSAQIELDDASAYVIAEQHEAGNIMSKLSDEIDSAIDKATSFADRYNLDFSLNPAYGMGGTYDGEDGEWHPSSQSC